jgi:hypothetical protein
VLAGSRGATGTAVSDSRSGSGTTGKFAVDVPGLRLPLSLTSGGGVGPTVCVSISAYALAFSLELIYRSILRGTVLLYGLDLRPPAPIILPSFVLRMLNACQA